MESYLDCVVFVTAKNNVGDPDIKEVDKICSAYEDTTYVFLNCDLSDRVTTGMTEKSVRDAFRNTIQPAFYFRNIVKTNRPSMVPSELGVI